MKIIFGILKSFGIPSIIFSLIMTLRVLGFYVGPIELISYCILIIYPIYLLKFGIKFDLATVLLLLYIPISILIDKPSFIFRSWERYFLFLLLMLCISPVLQSFKAKIFRRKVLKVTLTFGVIIAVISFMAYFMGINMMRSNYSGKQINDFITNNAGTFGGITSHSMLLGPIAGISVLSCSYLALTKTKKYIWTIVALICCGAMLFAASRSALFATLVGELILLWFFAKRKSVIIKRIVLITLVGMITMPLWNHYLDGINAKNTRDLQYGVNVNSRTDKWQLRIDEWKDNPITGIGFVSVSDRDLYTSNGVIEPGSSWLAILSMTGIIGFVLFCYIYGRAVKKSLFTYTPKGALFGGILIFLGIHMLAEGYIFSAGSYLCFLVWLTIGVCTDYAPQSKILITNKK